MSEAIRTSARPLCYLCGRQGVALYDSLRDRLFGAPGTWSLDRCPDPACGLIWLDPMPLEEDIVKAYGSYYTHAKERPKASLPASLFAAAKRGYLANRYGYYPEAGLAVRMLGLLPFLYPGRTPELDLSVMWLEAQSRGRLLDVGAGSGWLVGHLRELGWEAEGVDFDARAVEAAKARGLKMHLGSLPAQQFPGDRFDAVTMSHCIEHLHDPLAWLRECHRILKPGGRLVLATPNTASLGHRIFGRHWFALDPPRHLHLFNLRSLSRIVGEAGFATARAFTTIRDANGTFIAGRSIRRTGRHDMTARQPPAVRLWGRMAQLGEGAAALIRPEFGEDLVAIARKRI